MLVQCTYCKGVGNVQGWPRLEERRKCTLCDGQGRFEGIYILETDQWTSTGNVTDFMFDDLSDKMDLRQEIKGGDSEAAVAIFGGRITLRSVRETQGPSMGSVWYTKGPDGKAQFYRACYDSSG
jgi:hypothetical protein